MTPVDSQSEIRNPQSAMDMWECPKTHCKMFKARRKDFCASRREAAREGDTCFECKLKVTAEGEVGTYKNKVCVDCKTSKQVKDERCYKCFKKKHGHAPFGSPKASKNAPPAPSPASSSGQAKEAGAKKAKKQAGRQKGARATRGASSPRKIGKPSASASYVVEINFADYPSLHERLLEVAQREHRTADMQLVHLLSQEFERMESEAALTKKS